MHQTLEAIYEENFAKNCADLVLNTDPKKPGESWKDSKTKINNNKNKGLYYKSQSHSVFKEVLILTKENDKNSEDELNLTLSFYSDKEFMINEDSVEANKSISKSKDNEILHKSKEECKNNYETNDDTYYNVYNYNCASDFLNKPTYNNINK
jgi:hypothetical protein